MKRWEWFPRVCALVATGLCLSVLAGWVTGATALAAFGRGLLPMAPSTALLGLALAAAVLVGSRARWASAALSLLVASAGLALLAQWAIQIADVEDWLIPARPFSAAIVAGRMSPLTAAALVVLGATLGFLGLVRGPAPRTRDIAATSAAAIGLLGLVCVEGYLSRSPFLYGGSITPIALPTALVLMLLAGCVVAAAGPSAWPTRHFVGPSVRARLLRVLIPLFPAMVLAEGVLERVTWGATFVSPSLRHASVMLAFAALGMGVALRLSRHVHRVVAEAQVALAESEEHYRALVASATDAIITIDHAGIVVGWNPGAARMFGYSDEEVVGKSLEPLMPEAFRKRHRDASDLLGRGTAPRLLGRTLALEGLRKNGEAFPIDLSVSGWQTSGGRFFTGIVRDVTERQRAAETLRESRQFNEQIIASAQEGIVVYGPDARHQAWNPFMERLTGMRANEVLGKHPSEVGPFLGEAGVLERVDLALAGEAVADLDVPYEVPGTGRSGWVIDRVAPVRNATGEIVAALRTVHDVTQPKLQARETAVSARLLTLLSTSGDFRDHAADLTAALQDWSGCEAVGIRLRAGDDYPYFETRGFPRAFVQAENRLCAYGPDGRILRDGSGNPVLDCMCGNVLCGRFDPAKPFFTAHGSFWSNGTTALLASTTGADRLARTRNRCNGEGYESVALIPLRAGERVLGLLQFNDPRTDRFTPDLIASFERVADALAAALARHQAEEALRENEERYRDLFNNAEVGMFRTRLDGSEILEFNDKFLEILGRTREEVQSLPSVIHWANPQEREEMVRRLGAEGRVTDFKCRILDARGQVRHCLTSLRLDREDGLLEGSILDVTERETAEAALRENRALLRSVVNGTTDAIYVKDTRGRYLLFNAAAEKTVGKCAAEVLGRDDTFLLPPDEARAVMQGDRKVMESGAPTTYEEVVTDAAGRPTTFLSTKGPLHGEDGALVGLFGIARDITERKRLEDERRQLEAQFNRAQKMESLGSLAGGVAHDMNNVLAAIMALASVYQETAPEGTPLSNDMETIARACKRGGALVRSLLGFARQGLVEDRELDLNAVVRETVALLRRTTLQRVHVAADLDAGLSAMKGDPGALGHALMNLCLNAVDAMPPGGTLTLRTRNEGGGRVLLQVADTGSGMPRDVLDKALDPFFTTKAQGKGTGLGLSIVYGTVKAHRGTMEIASEPGRGTLVAMRFPACEPRLPDAAPDESGPARSQAALHVLLVDDDELIQRSLQRMLKSLGHSFTVAESGEEALAELEAGLQPDVAILDINMPGLGGAGTLPRLRALRPAVPVLLATGRIDQAALDLAAAHPRVRLLAKPFGMAELSANLDEALGPRRRGTAEST